MPWAARCLKLTFCQLHAAVVSAKPELKQACTAKADLCCCVTDTGNTYLQVRKLMITGYDMRQVTGDDIGKADYIAAQKQVRPPDGHHFLIFAHLLLSCQT